MTTDICVTCRNHSHVLSSFVYVQMTTDICITYRNHSHVLSSFVTQYWVCNTMGVTSGTGTAYPSIAHERSCGGASCCSIFSILQIIVCSFVRFPLAIVSSVLRFIPFGIFKLFLPAIVVTGLLLGNCRYWPVARELSLLACCQGNVVTGLLLGKCRYWPVARKNVPMLYVLFITFRFKMKLSVDSGILYLITPYIRMLDSDWLIAVIFFFIFRPCIVNLQNFYFMQVYLHKI